MALNQRLLDALNAMIVEGEAVWKEANRKSQPNEMPVPVGDRIASEWGLTTITIIESMFGEDNRFNNQLNTNFRQLGDYHQFNSAIGVAKAAKKVYENGYHQSIETRITADVFEDFLEQAEYLLSGGYHQAAAVTAGAVLEDGLRKLCEKNEIEFDKKDPTINDYNSELPKHGIYEKTTAKQILWLGAVRNHAAHGEWDKFTREDVERMIPSIRDFMVKYF